MKGQAIVYNQAEIAFLKANETTPRTELTVAFNKRFGRNISRDNIKAKCTRMGLKTGRTGCFAKGSIPPNKGKKGWYAPGSEKGWFKKGTIPSNQRPMGSERTDSKDGYVYIKIDIINPYTGHQGHFVPKHRYLWESQNGPIPDGHFLKCLDGDRLNTEPSNWECLPNGMKPRLVAGHAGQDYDNAPDDLKPTIMVTAKIAQRVHEINKADVS